MTLAIERINNWWYRDVSAAPLGLSRIFLGLLSLLYLVMLWPDRFAFFCEGGLFPTARVLQVAPTTAPDLLVRASLAQVDCVIGLGVIAAISLTLGQWPRLSAFWLWLVECSLQVRGPYVHNGADILLRMLVAVLIVSPCGNAFSVDRWLKALPAVGRVSVWPLRLMQLQVCSVYLQGALLKLQGDKWINGTALHYALGLESFHRFPVPGFVDTPLVINALTWSVVAFELCFAFLVWRRAWRLPLLCGALALHIGIEYAMNVPLFSGAMLCGCCAFLRGREIQRVVVFARRFPGRVYSRLVKRFALGRRCFCGGLPAECPICQPASQPGADLVRQEVA